MRSVERRVAREAKATTRAQILMKAIAREISWVQAADILGATPRHLLRVRRRVEGHGFGSLRDGRGGRLRRKRIPVATIRELCRLRRECYPDFSVRHFYERATEIHGLTLSDTGTLRAVHLRLTTATSGA